MSESRPVTTSVSDDPADRRRFHLRDDEIALAFRQEYGPDNASTTIMKVTVEELRATRAAIDAYLNVHDTFLGT